MIRVLFLFSALFLILAQSATAAPARYRVQPGDSLYTIARSTGVSVEEIKRLNGLKGNLIKPGQELLLSRPPKAAKAKRKSAVAVDAGGHVVQPGETLYGIARKGGISVEELKRLNGLAENLIQPGQVLVLREIPVEAAASVGAAEADVEPPPLTIAVNAEEGVADPAGIQTEGEKWRSVTDAFLAIPYRFGSETRNATDCSGFVQQVFRELSVELPRSAREQYRVGEPVPVGKLRPGDLLFYRTYAKYPSHVGIYLGDGKMIHASRVHRKVVISDINTKYFRTRFIGAKRVATFDPSLLEPPETAPAIEELNEEGLLEAEAAQDEESPQEHPYQP